MRHGSAPVALMCSPQVTYRYIANKETGIFNHQGNEQGPICLTGWLGPECHLCCAHAGLSRDYNNEYTYSLFAALVWGRLKASTFHDSWVYAKIHMQACMSSPSERHPSQLTVDSNYRRLNP